DSQTGQGGKITLEGQNIHLAGGSLTSATGKTGGGEVYVGGGWQGQDSHIKNASKVVMDKTATADVSATENGNGGTAVLWSDDYTNFRGTVLAKGGAKSGHGGRVETSSHRNLQASGEVDASARAGHGGEWLLDPTDVTIVGTGADTGVDSVTADGTDIFTPTASGAQILNSSIVNQLNAGTNVTVKTSGTDTEGQTGNIRVNANIVKTSGADAKLTLLADNNIATADRVSIGATTGKLNLDLLAGNTTNNASITLGKFINISLNGGDFLAGAANPDNAVSLMYSNNGQIHGGNVTLNLPRGLNGYAYKVQADDDLTINGPVNGNTGWDVPLSFIAGGKLEMNSPGGISLQANDTRFGGGRVLISGDKGVTLNAANGTVLLKAATAATNDVNITSSNGAVSLSGMAQKGSNGLTLTNANITASNGITLNGTTETGAGVSVTGSNLSAPSLGVNGVASVSGTGFSLATSHLLGGLTDLVNVSLSSAGSAAGAINLLDGSIVNDANRDTLMAKRIENMTSLDMGGQTIFDDSAKTDKGWTQDYSLADLPSHGWIFTNTSVTAGGDVNLKGAGFSNATVTVNNGNLNINGGSVPLTGSTITVKDGAVNVHAGVGNIDLSKSNISAKGDITLQADGGSIAISGTSTTVKSSITSAEGNISAVAYNPSTGGVTGISVTNAQLNAEQGNININGTTPGTMSGVRFTNADLKANADTGSITVYGESKGLMGYLGERGSIYIGGTDTFSAKNIDIIGYNASQGIGSGVVFDDGVSASFNGETLVSGTGLYVGVNFWNTVHLDFIGGESLIKGKITGPGVFELGHGLGAIAGTNLESPVSVYINLTHADLKINGDSSASTTGTITAIGIMNKAAHADRLNGFIFQGNGDVDISGTSSDGNAVDTRLFDNTALSGNFTVTGKSVSGAGVYLAGPLNTSLVNATITGISESGNGVTLAAESGTTSLGNNTISGTSETGTGIQLTGNNITLTSGTLTGTATSGKGSGVVLTGGSNYTLDGASVTGTAADGSGISVNGSLTVNNGTAVKGYATGSGNGVTLSGDLATNSGDGIAITGTALSGDGIKVDGDTTLTSASVTGHTDSGAGVNIAGNLTTDSATQVSGDADSGTGISLGAALTGASVKGNSDTGTGLQLADNAVVTKAVLNGTSTSGDGVAVSGKVTLDDASAAALNASSASGTGLKLADNANVSIQTVTSVTQAKQDADGNPVLDADGNAVMETVTTQAPVTTPVTLTGTSAQGTGVATEGNVSVSGIVLSGSTDADTGTGVSLGGNLTIADDISGVTAGATGNGTALAVNNVSIHSDGYTDSGKDFVINASVSGNGTAIKTQGSSQLDGVMLNGNAKGGGTAVELGGQVSGANITGTSDSGTGLQVSGNASLSNTGLTGTTQTGTGIAVTGNLKADTSSQMTGSAIQDGGTGVTLDGTMTGVTVTGDATSGDAVHIADGSQLTATVVKGNSVDGAGIRTEGNVSLLGGTHLTGSASSAQGTALDVSGTLTHDPDSSVTTSPDNAGNVTGSENIHEVIPVVPPVPDEGSNSQPDQNPAGGTDKPAVDNPSVPSEPVHDQEHGREHDVSLSTQAEVTSQRRGAVNAQVTQRSQPPRDGFHSAGIPPVLVEGYIPAAQPVDISLCDGDHCQSDSLDTGKPVKENVTPSGR
ncbi:hypothetical protein BRR55_25460, partial [Salmonella enterica]|nr:hypothetical protein [Salmonella enterica]